MPISASTSTSGLAPSRRLARLHGRPRPTAWPGDASGASTGGAPPGSAARSRASASRRIEHLTAPGLGAPAARRRLRAAGTGPRCY
eukprot:10351768-Alexandrium_andersonii.AAC.1